ncbi:hypothetical protein Asppvi_002021 [Aspergillus pseudoviridinutans]|uniref:Uncharacterized protein n=1 Tax=Aspergillus pseudoviridinutans TaxID=1517512 RepID=A0A9P3BPR4_9EURO|nr:uncharacterized protein Asppvi_002021 [Aspergillus pseudoviridinutans]GIJ92743.1 hypothetical protein Asppvi_002021 [Aspergillus pseudoviridinutans]
MTVDQLIQALDQVSEQLWETSLDDPTFEILKARCSRLSAQVAVHHALQKTGRLILKSALKDPLPNAQSRICKFFDALYSGEKTNSTSESRWQQLRDLDCKTFLFIAVSYTPLDITKMNRTEFEYLVRNATKYLEKLSLPLDWIFRKEIQLAIVEKSDLPDIRLFKKRYHDLEFSVDNSHDTQPEKRFRQEQQNVQRRTDQEAFSTQQPEHVLVPREPRSEARIRLTEGPEENPVQSQNESSVAGSFSYIPLTEAGAEVILQSVREGNGYQFNIVLPKPNVPQPQPLMLIPLQICADIIKKYTS